MSVAPSPLAGSGLDDAPLPPAAVVAGPDEGVLRAISSERVGLALWWRTLCPTALNIAEELLDEPAFRHEAAGRPDEAADALAALLPLAARPLRQDFGPLAALFARLAGTALVRMRLEQVWRQTCPRLHVDAVSLRLLCTYAGHGTEWQDVAGTVRRMPIGHVGLFKGTRHPGPGISVPHRSPPGHGGRLLLCIDALRPH